MSITTGVLPLPLPEKGIPLGEVTALHSQAQLALGQADEIARSLPDPYQISRILSRREAVSSSAMEGTHSTLDELLIAELLTIRQGRRFDRFGIRVGSGAVCTIGSHTGSSNLSGRADPKPAS